MKNLIDLVRRLHAGFVHIVSHLQSPMLLVVRLYWGWQLAQTGWAKLQHLDKITGFFASLGIPHPGPTAAFVAFVEFVGGILLAIGLFSRVTGLALAIDMIVAYITADHDALFSFFSDPGKFYNADPYTFLFASLLILIFGPGLVALDTLLARRASATRPKSVAESAT
ncbi:MAG TPA: DoxX family protein [Candidatus Aquilonibacter sp.]|nr:DoxX family protein [Candidatus Aquilonibacter sp.]